VGSSESPRLTIDRDEGQRIAAEYLRQQGVDSVEDRMPPDGSFVDFSVTDAPYAPGFIPR